MWRQNILRHNPDADQSISDEDVDEPDDASPKDVVSLKAINASAAASNKHFPSPNSSDGMGFGDRGSTIIFNPRVL